VVYFVFHFMTVRTVWMQRIHFKTYRWLIITLVSLLRHLQNSNKMKNKIYHTVRTVIKWEKNYTTLFEQSSNEKQNIAHLCYILFFILWQIELCGLFFFSFYDSSNGVLYFVFHLIIFRTVCYILFFIYDSSNCVLYFFKKKKHTFEILSNEKQNIAHRSNCH
jgi:hypothetical protein